MINYKVLGKRIYRLRKAKGWRMQDLSNECEVSITTICQLESAKLTNVEVGTLGKIAGVFGLTFSQLIDEEEAV